MDGKQMASGFDDWTWLDRREVPAGLAPAQGVRPWPPARPRSTWRERLRQRVVRWQLGPAPGSACWREQDGRPGWAD